MADTLVSRVPQPPRASKHFKVKNKQVLERKNFFGVVVVFLLVMFNEIEHFVHSESVHTYFNPVCLDYFSFVIKNIS